jgi:hypothetical protein
MDNHPQLRKPGLKYIVLGVVLVVGLLLFVIYSLLNNQLFEVSVFSSLSNASDVRQMLVRDVVIGKSNLAEVEVAMGREGVNSCSSVDSRLICFTAAPKEFVRTDDWLRDLGNYLIVVNSYRIEFQFQDAVLTQVEVAKFGTGF